MAADKRRSSREKAAKETPHIAENHNDTSAGKTDITGY